MPSSAPSPPIGITAGVLISVPHVALGGAGVCCVPLYTPFVPLGRLRFAYVLLPFHFSILPFFLSPQL